MDSRSQISLAPGGPVRSSSDSDVDFSLFPAVSSQRSPVPPGAATAAAALEAQATLLPFGGAAAGLETTTDQMNLSSLGWSNQVETQAERMPLERTPGGTPPPGADFGTCLLPPPVEMPTTTLYDLEAAPTSFRPIRGQGNSEHVRRLDFDPSELNTLPGRGFFFFPTSKYRLTV